MYQTELKHFTFIDLFNPHHSPMRKEVICCLRRMDLRFRKVNFFEVTHSMESKHTRV